MKSHYLPQTHPFRRRLHPLPFLLSLIFLLSSLPTGAQILFEDSFDDGVIDTNTYTPIGNAILTEANGKMTIRALAAGDGVSIVMPSDGKCISLSQFIPEVELDIGDEWAVSGFFSNAPEPDVEAIQVALLRPHWNRCQVKITIAEKTQVVGFWGCSEKSLKRSCPKTAQKIRIDWVKTPEGEERIQVEIRQADGSYKVVADRKTKLSHEGNGWTKMNVVMLKEGQKKWVCPNPQGIGGGIIPNQGDPPGLVMEMEDITVTGDHPNPPAAPVQINPNTVVPGEVIDQMQITLSDPTLPLFLEPDVSFSLGPGFLIENFQVIDGLNATAKVTVSDRARRNGAMVKVETDEIILESYIHVERDANPEINTQPDMAFNCPEKVLEGQPFGIDIIVEDPDQDFVIIEAVVELNEIPEQILVESPYTAYPTPAIVNFEFPGLPPGDYIILALADDGLVEDGGSLCACAFEVIDPTVSTMESVLPDQQILIHPNPAQEDLSIQFNLLQSTQLDISLVTIYGEELSLRSDFMKAGFQQFDLTKPTGIPAGVYFVKFSTKEGVLTKKVIFM